MLVLFTDTDTDMTPEKAKKYGYHLISMPYSIDGTTVYPYEDFDVFEYRAFYTQLRNGTIPTTSSNTEERYLAYFEPILQNGDDILYVHFSKALSATFNHMDLAIKKLLEKYPDRRIDLIDTKSNTIGSLTIVEEIGEMYLAGKTTAEMLAWAEKEVDHFALYFFADDLRFFRRSGRVSGIAATMGNMIGIRPIIYINDEGKLVSIAKERGRARAMARLVQYVADLGDDIKSHPVIIGHTDAPEIAGQIADMMHEKFGEDLQIEVLTVNPTSGSHCGPDGVGISFHAVHR